MKTMTKIISFVLLAVMVLSLVSCSSFSGIRSNFEKHGYVYVENGEENSLFAKINAELQSGEIPCTFHLFKYEGKADEDEDKGFLGGLLDDITNAVDYCGVIEFGSSKELEAALEESAALKGLVKDAQKSSLVNGNCVLIAGVVRIEEKTQIFNGEKVK